MLCRIDVPPTLPPGCRIVFVGEAAGPDEYRQREGFVGRAGKLLDKILFAGGLSRQDVGLTNVVKRAPDCECQHDIALHNIDTFRCTQCKCEYYNGFDSEHFRKTFYETYQEEIVTESKSTRCKECGCTIRQHAAKHPKKACKTFEPVILRKIRRGIRVANPTQELQDYYQVLKRELESAQPNVVVACGNEALKALCNLDGITRYRGSILPSTLVPGLKVVPLVHPSAILRSQWWQEVYVGSRIIRDKIVPQSKYRELRYEPWNEILMPTIEQVECVFARVGNKDWWVIDIETRETGDIACVGMCCNLDGMDTAICIPLQTTKGPYFTQANEARFRHALQELADRNSNLVMQNGFFDLSWLQQKCGFRPSGWHDLMLLFHRMYPELPKKLSFSNMLLNDIPYYKHMARAEDDKCYRFVSDEKLWPYNIRDCVAELRAWRKLLDETGKDREKQLYFSHTYDLMPLGFEMQALGLDVDRQGMMLARQVLRREYGKIRRTLKRLSNDQLVTLPGNTKISDSQIHRYLYHDLCLPIKTGKAAGSETADKDAIVELMIRHPELEVLKAIIAERKCFKALSGYLARELFYEQP